MSKGDRILEAIYLPEFEKDVDNTSQIEKEQEHEDIPETDRDQEFLQEALNRAT